MYPRQDAEAFCENYIDPVVSRYHAVREDVLDAPMDTIKKMEADLNSLAALSHALHSDARFPELSKSERDNARMKNFYNDTQNDVTQARLFKSMRAATEEFKQKSSEAFKRMEKKAADLTGKPKGDQ